MRRDSNGIAEAEDDELLDLIAAWLGVADPMPSSIDLLLLFGGRGHTTDVLESVLGDRTGATEADLTADYLERQHGI